jgi:hypothetical protein
MEFYNGQIAWFFKVPNGAMYSRVFFSWCLFPNEVTRVRIYSGSAALSSTQDDLTDGGGEDLMVWMILFIANRRIWNDAVTNVFLNNNYFKQKHVTN